MLRMNMKKQTKIMSVILAVAIILSNISFTISTVYSDDSLKNLKTFDSLDEYIEASAQLQKKYDKELSEVVDIATAYSSTEKSIIINENEKLQEATRKPVLEAKKYLDDEGFVVISSDEENVQILNPYQTKRLIVIDDNLTDGYGAQEILHFDDEYMLQFNSVEEALTAFKEIKNNQEIENVYYDSLVHADENVNEDIDQFYPVSPDDLDGSSKHLSWGVSIMGLDQMIVNLENNNKELDEVTVAVLDTGCDYNDLLKTKIDTEKAFNVYKGTNDVDDGDGHGTHVCGIIADGTSKNVKIIPIKVLSDNGIGTLGSVKRGLLKAIEYKVDAANISLSAEDPESSYDYLDTILEKAVKNNIVICASAGNDYESIEHYYPSRSPYVLSVGALDTSLGHAEFSNVGPSLDFVAPGRRILSTFKDNKLAYKSGTSMATPHLTAAVALLKTWNDDLSFDEVQSILIENSEDLGEPGKDDIFGYGYVNLANFNVSHECKHIFVSNIEKEATCTEKGSIVYTCQKCGYSYREDLPELGHNFEKKIIKPTCELEGYTSYTCKRCGEYFTSDKTSATGHDYIEEVKRIPTCTSDGLKVFTCSHCGNSYSEAIKATGHKYISVITKEANHKEEGIITHTCEYCGDSYTEVIPKEDHVFNDKIVPPTCTEDGYTEHICDCGFSYKDTYTERLDHNFVESDRKEPTCKEEGYVKYTCSRCHEEKTEVLKKVEHKYSQTVVAPTCTENGYTIYACDICGHSFKGDNVEALGHSYVDTVVAPTCTEDGYTLHTCNRCHDSYRDNIIKTEGHKYSVIITEPSCTDPGVTSYTCSTCGHHYETEIPATGHDYRKEIKEPTCTEKGYIKHTCKKCKNSYIEQELPALGHNYTNKIIEPTCEHEGYTLHVCTLCGEQQKDSIIPKLDHEFKVKVTKKPTCTAEGFRTYTCIHCGHTHEETISALGHDLLVEIVAPTCNSKGYIKYSCKRCEYTKTEYESSPTGHDYEKVEEISPTCQNEGLITYKCKKCGHTYTETIPQIDHVYDVKVINPSCITEGYTLYTCKLCGEAHKENIVPIIPHEYESKVTKHPTCDHNGEMIYTCKICGKTYTEVILASGEHNFNMTVVSPTCTEQGYTLYECKNCDYSYKDNYTEIVPHKYTSKIIKESTCEEAGIVKHTCEYCGESYTETIEPLKHDYKVETVTPTCEHGGYNIYTCSKCGHSYKDNVLPKIDHEYIETITKEPTCTAEGEKTYVCKFCNRSYTEKIKALEHNYIAKTVEPTCEHEGYVEHTCSLCGKTYSDSVIPKIPHNYIVKTIKPTIVRRGYDLHTCEMCGHTYKDNYISQMHAIKNTVNNIFNFFGKLFN